MIKSKESFDIRSGIKFNLHKNQENIFVNNREIWYISLGNNIWYEEDWKWDNFFRPVLVIFKVWNMFYVIPMTTKWKNSKYYQ